MSNVAIATALDRRIDLPADGAKLGELQGPELGRWLLPAGELYAAAQAAPNTARSYRSTLRSFALFLRAELGVAATVDALVLSTIVDYKRWLQATDPATGRPRAQTATIASSSPPCADSRADSRWMRTSASMSTRAFSWSRSTAATHRCPAH